MNIQILETSRTASGTYFQASCEKKTALVAIHSWGVQVICQNAANRVWKGGGRHFPTIAAAIMGYKSGEMKAIIRAAGEFNAETEVAAKEGVQ